MLKIPFARLCGTHPPPIVRALAEQFRARAAADISLYDRAPLDVAILSILLRPVERALGTVPDDLYESLRVCAHRDLASLKDAGAFIALAARSAGDPDTMAAKMSGVAAWLHDLASDPHVAGEVWPVNRGPILFLMEAFAPTVESWTLPSGARGRRVFLTLLATEHRFRRISPPRRQAYPVTEGAAAALSQSLERCPSLLHRERAIATAATLLDNLARRSPWPAFEEWVQSIQGRTFHVVDDVG